MEKKKVAPGAFYLFFIFFLSGTLSFENDTLNREKENT